MKRALFALIFLCWIGVIGAARGDSSRLVRTQGPWDVQVWRPSGAVLSFARTNEGFVWAGTQQGLFRFDGSVFERQAVPQTTPLRGQVLVTDSEGSLWLGLGAGGLRVGKSGKVEIIHSGFPGVWRQRHGEGFQRVGDPALQNAHVWSFATEKRGDVWIGTETGLIRFHGEHVSQVFSQTQGLEDTVVLSLAASTDGTCWVGTRSGLQRLRDGRLSPSLLEGPILSLLVDADQRTWVGTTRGLFVVDDDQVPKKVFRDADLSSKEIWALAASDEGAIWIGTSEGLGRLEKNGALTSFGALEGLPDERITGLLNDGEGGVLIGTRAGGVARLHRRTIWNFGLREGLPSEAVNAVLAAQDGSVWVSTLKGLARIQPLGDSITVQDSAIAVPGPMAQAAQHQVWVGRDDGSLDRVSADMHTQSVFVGRGSRVTSLLADLHGEAWAGWEDGTLAHVSDNGALAFIDRGRGACGGPMIAMATNASRHLWAITPKGVEHIAPSEATSCMHNPGGMDDGNLSSVTVDCCDENASLWIGARWSSGFVRISDGKVRHYRDDDGLYCDSIHALVRDLDKGLWTVCEGGVAWLNFNSLEATVASQAVSRISFGLLDGLRGEETALSVQPLASLGLDGRLWVATLAGVSAIASPQRDVVRVRPHAPISTVFVDGNEAASMVSQINAYGKAVDLKIGMTVPTLLAPGRVPLRWRLSGLETKWTIAAPPFVVHFDRLVPGTYRFLLQAGDGYGNWGPMAPPLTLKVRARWYQTAVLPIASVIFLLAAVFLSLWARARRQGALMGMVQAERARMARELHDGLGQGFASLGMHLDTLRKRLSDLPDSTQALLQRMRSLIDILQVEVRRNIWDMREASLTERTLQTELATMVRRLAESIVTDKPRIAFRSTGECSLATSDMLHELPRVAQEAITNAIRHAQATLIEVLMTCDEDGVSLWVRDDGRGLSPGAKDAHIAGHFGLLGMRERVRRLGGNIVIETRPEGGTEVKMQVPWGNE